MKTIRFVEELVLVHLTDYTFQLINTQVCISHDNCPVTRKG
ncbi:hypothetical protein [Virgibacillus senegalensis]|nr:hypothetical protein [Virgibacillus senegalensis]